MLSGLAGIAGVALLMVSFDINGPPPQGATGAELVKWGQENYVTGLWGAWLQAVAPVFLVFFALAVVHLSGAAQRLAGWMTFFGATVLSTVSLIEITFYISAWSPDPAILPVISLKFISAAQHLFFILAAPALFVPLGFVLIGSPILPRVFGYLALLLAAIFAALGVVFLMTPSLPAGVTALGSVQGLWWLGAAVAMFVKGIQAWMKEDRVAES